MKKKSKFKKFFLGILLVSFNILPITFLASCSGATNTQIPAWVKLDIKGTNILLKNKYEFLPTQQPSFKKGGSILDLSKDQDFINYWLNLIGPAYSISMPSLLVDSASANSNHLSKNATIRDMSFNYAISNSWISGSEIYGNKSLRFKTMPYYMSATINGDIPKIDKDTIINSSNVKTEIEMKDLIFDFSYFNINNGLENVNAYNELNNFFNLDKLLIKNKYRIEFNFSSKLLYEIRNKEDDKIVTITPDLKYDESKMKIHFEKKYYIGLPPSSGSATPANNEIVIEEALENFSKWYLNPVNISPIYANFIKSISELK